jgi:hypothetical protein
MPVARELARALDRGQAPGLLAPILFVVLSASSLDEAHAHLDEAGLPRLDVEKVSEPAAGHAAGLGGEASPDDMASAEGRPDSTQPALDGDQHSQADEMVPGGGAGGPQQPGENADTAGGSPGPATGARDDRERQPTPVGTPEASGHSATEGSLPDSGGRSSRRKQGRRSRLRSYVLPPSEDEDSQDADSQRSPVDHAGVHRVVALEEAQGRFPALQPHNNPGFDVASFSATGELLRHIEVKSTDGPWDEMGVGLSPRQLEFAEDHPETFWLYVVEYATDDQRARVFGIPDPASKIEEYRFDSGWAAAAEDLSAPPSLPADVMYAPERPGVSWLPVHQMDHLDASTSPSAWIPWDGSSDGSGFFAVQVLGYALEPGIPRGSLVIVEPSRQPAPHDLVLVEFEDGRGGSGQAAATIRYWEPDIDPESGQLVGVTLAADESSGIEDIDASASMLRVIGRVVDTLRPATRLG